MKCPVCGSDVALELGFIIKIGVVEREGKFYGQLETENAPDFVSWFCDNCGEGGEVIDDSRIDIFAKAKLVANVEWAPNNKTE